MAKTIAYVFGIVFLLAGILAFVPAFAPNDMLLGILHVNGLHNIIHLLTGLIALVCAMMGQGASRAFFKAFGIIYLLVALLGFVAGDGEVLGVIANNMADAVFHLVVAVIFLVLGFGGGSRSGANA